MGERKRHGLSKRRKGFILLVGFVCVVFIGALIGWHYEQQNNEQIRGVATQGVGKLNRIEYAGQNYVEKTALTSLLLIGTDRPSNSTGYGARQGGQADFLMLVVIDHENKKISQLQIDRDTITEVETLGILGNPIGTKSMQICLAHVFGTSREENCGFVQRAVENLLEGIEIDYCIELGLEAIGTLNHALGGVTVTLDEDLTYVDSQMWKGNTLRLTDEQAELLVRGRMELGDGTNESRMRRQRLFIEGAVQVLRAETKKDVGFIEHVLGQLEGDMMMTIQQSVLLNEVNQAYAYEVLPVQTLQGEHCIGADGFMEFHVTEGATAQWVMGTFYEQDH